MCSMPATLTMTVDEKLSAYYRHCRDSFKELVLEKECVWVTNGSHHYYRIPLLCQATCKTDKTPMSLLISISSNTELRILKLPSLVRHSSEQNEDPGTPAAEPGVIRTGLCTRGRVMILSWILMMEALKIMENLQKTLGTWSSC